MLAGQEGCPIDEEAVSCIARLLLRFVLAEILLLMDLAIRARLRRREQGHDAGVLREALTLVEMVGAMVKLKLLLIFWVQM